MEGRLAQVALRWERRLGVGGGVAFLICVLGCMSLNVGHLDTVQPADANVQSGKLTIPANQTLDVFYPSPFIVTPNLVVENTCNDCKVVEQRPNLFRIQNPMMFAREITWTARGEKIPAEVLLQSLKAAAPGTPPEPASSTSTAAGLER